MGKKKKDRDKEFADSFKKTINDYSIVQLLELYGENYAHIHYGAYIAMSRFSDRNMEELERKLIIEELTARMGKAEEYRKRVVEAEKEIKKIKSAISTLTNFSDVDKVKT